MFRSEPGSIARPLLPSSWTEPVFTALSSVQLCFSLDTNLRSHRNERSIYCQERDCSMRNNTYSSKWLPSFPSNKNYKLLSSCNLVILNKFHYNPDIVFTNINRSQRLHTVRYRFSLSPPPSFSPPLLLLLLSLSPLYYSYDVRSGKKLFPFRNGENVQASPEINEVGIKWNPWIPRP